MASDYLLEIDGIKGEVNDARHPDSFRVQSFSWGVSNSGSGGGGGGGVGKAVFQDLHFTINNGKGCPTMALACATGKHFPKAILTCRKTGGGQTVDTEKYELKDILITSVAHDGNRGSAAATLLVAMSYSEITIEVLLRNPDGSTVPETVHLINPG